MHESLESSVRNRTIDDVLDVLISSGGQFLTVMSCHFLIGCYSCCLKYSHAVLVALTFIKMGFSRRKSATKFLYVKTFRSKVVKHSLAYLTMHEWLLGDVTLYLKFWAK